MRILFDSILSNCNVSATNTNTNFPVGNLDHPFLRKIWKSNNNTDTITIEQSGQYVPINSIYMGYTNATSITMTVFGFDRILLNGYTVGFGGDSVLVPAVATSSPIPITDVYHSDLFFTKITLALVASSPVYVGRISLGTDILYDPPESFWDESFEDKSIVSVSDAGQVLQEFVQPLRIWNFNIPTMDRTEARAFEDEYIGCGVGCPIFVDPQTDDLPVLYCRFSDPIVINKNKRQYAARMQFKEAR